MGLKEIISTLKKVKGSYKIYCTGFMPDFLPAWLVFFLKLIEAVLEKLPVVNLMSDHNVVAFRKDS